MASNLQELNNLDAGGDGGGVRKVRGSGRKLNLQDRMRRKFQNRSQSRASSNSDNASADEQQPLGAFRPIGTTGIVSSGGQRLNIKSSQSGKDYSDKKDSDSDEGSTSTSSGSNRAVIGTTKISKATSAKNPSLNLVSQNKEDKLKRQKSKQIEKLKHTGSSMEMFQNNFDDADAQGTVMETNGNQRQVRKKDIRKPVTIQFGGLNLDHTTNSDDTETDSEDGRTPGFSTGHLSKGKPTTKQSAGRRPQPLGKESLPSSYSHSGESYKQGSNVKNERKYANSLNDQDTDDDDGEEESVIGGFRFGSSSKTTVKTAPKGTSKPFKNDRIGKDGSRVTSGRQGKTKVHSSKDNSSDARSSVKSKIKVDESDPFAQLSAFLGTESGDDDDDDFDDDDDDDDENLREEEENAERNRKTTNRSAKRHGDATTANKRTDEKISHRSERSKPTGKGKETTRSSTTAVKSPSLVKMTAGQQPNMSSLVGGTNKGEDPMASFKDFARGTQAPEDPVIQAFQSTRPPSNLGMTGSSQPVSQPVSQTVGQSVGQPTTNNTTALQQTNRPEMKPLHPGGGYGAPGFGLGGQGGQGQPTREQMMQFMQSERGAELMKQFGGAGGGQGGASPLQMLLGGVSGGQGGGVGQQMVMSGQGRGRGRGEEEEVVNVDNPDDMQVIHQMLAYESMRSQTNSAPEAQNALNTIIIVDTSGSMSGTPLIEAGQFISEFLEGLEKMQFEFNLEENVALISIGEGIQVVQHFTNDFSLIRNATDTLNAEGPSKLHVGLMLPISLIRIGQNEKNGIHRINEVHSACPRVIVITDGHISNTPDVPGMSPRQDDQNVVMLQNLTMELINQVTSKTLCKIYCVPVGNSNINFLEMLSTSSGGTMLQPSDAKRVSRNHLYHNVVAVLKAKNKDEPSKENIEETIKRVTSQVEYYDAEAVLEVWRQGEPDLVERDRQLASQMQQHQEQGGMQGMPDEGMMPGGRGRGGGRGGGQDLAAMFGGGTGMLPGGMGGGMPGGMGGGGALGLLGAGGRGAPPMGGVAGLLGRGMPQGAGGMGGLENLAGLLGAGGGMPSMEGMGGGNMAGLLGAGRGMGGGGMPPIGGGRGGGMSPFPGMQSMGGGGGGMEAMFGGGRGAPPASGAGGADLSKLFGFGGGRGGPPGGNNV